MLSGVNRHASNHYLECCQALLGKQATDGHSTVIRPPLFNKQRDVEVMRGGDVSIQVPKDGTDVYHLKYTGKSCTFARNTERTFAKLGLAFIEPNPTNRT